MLTVEYYSDVLCVWAWIAQRRIEELVTQFGDQVAVQYRYMDIFGDVDAKMSGAWSERGGYAGFAEHVLASAASFDTAPVNPDNWQGNRPRTSGNAHLAIKAVELASGAPAAAAFARSVREAFFVEARDVGSLDVLFDVLRSGGLPEAPARELIDSGAAMAALLGDYQRAAALKLRGSPSYVMNGERQILYGNVGYRVLSANVEELLKQVEHEASWC
ncbi:MAG: DsbA family protein [Halioglobus sp.]|nr:DsbA family protein [Halioglobus sp.]